MGAIQTGITEVTPTVPDFVPEGGMAVLPNVVPTQPIVPYPDADSEEARKLAIVTEAFKVGPAPYCEKHRHTPCGPAEIKDITAYARMSINDFLALVQAGKEKGVSIDDYVRLAEYLYGQFYVSVDVYCENGSMMIRRDATADARAVIRLGDEDVTDRIPASFFTWERDSGDEEKDEIWNLLHEGVGPVIHITRLDINGSCTFNCLIPIESIKHLNLNKLCLQQQPGVKYPS